jgi:dTDP-4-dehydrorhamnose reductase
LIYVCKPEDYAGMEKCLITGATGFVGRALLARLGEDFDAVGVSFTHRAPACVAADIRDPAVFRALLKDVRPGIVVHAAAYPDPDFVEAHPEEARRLNVESVRTLIDAVPERCRIVFLSTDYVFDGHHPPYREGDERNPLSLYGSLKREAEDLLAGRPDALVVRIPLQVGAGPSLNRPGFIREMVDAIRSGRSQMADDVLVRFPTWTGHTAEAVAFLLGKDATGTYHVSGQRGGTRYYWTVETARIMGCSAGHIIPSSAVISRKAARPTDAQLATDKIRALGYRRSTDFEAVVRMMLSAQ